MFDRVEVTVGVIVDVGELDDVIEEVRVIVVDGVVVPVPVLEGV